MSWELSYDTYISGVSSNRLESEIEECEDYKKRIENEIFALILMDPSKVRNSRKRSKKDSDYDSDDYSYLNNAQYLTKLWEELKEQWEENHSKLVRCSDAKYAVERKTRKVHLCPDCMVELHCEPKKDDNGVCYRYLPTCPKCGKTYSTEYSNADDMPKAVVAEIDTWSEG